MKYKVTTYYVTHTEEVVEAINEEQAIARSRFIDPDLYKIQVEDNMNFDRFKVEIIPEGE